MKRERTKKVIIMLLALSLVTPVLVGISHLLEKPVAKEGNKDKFEGDVGYDIEEELDIPKVLFVYSDPTPHHPGG